jgi:voltage-gated potassium channel Kch
LLLFLSSKFVPENCWLQHIGIHNSTWASKYIYSLYWAVTTIVTVGYGDITPQNEYEVVVTILIEVSGSALFGYLINVIGATMAELK